MFMPISGIFCPYSPMNGPELRNLMSIKENNDINSLYSSQMDRYRRNNAVFGPYFSTGGQDERCPGDDEWRGPKIVYNISNNRLEQGDTYDDENNCSYRRMEI